MSEGLLLDCAMFRFSLKAISLFSILFGGLAQAKDHLQIINEGIAGLEKRLEMVEHADTSIDVEYYIYNQDQAGRLFTQALVRKKHQNPEIKIRILIDASLVLPNLGKDVISVLAENDIEVRLYNHATIFHLSSAQFRDHRKLLIIDGKEAITGSRNMADEYFELSPRYNFRDRDIWIEGPIVTDIEKSFEAYWDSDVTSEPKLKNNPKSKAWDFIVENEHDQFVRSELARVGKPQLNDPNSFGECDKLNFVTDEAGYQSPDTRIVVKKVFSRLSEMKEGEKLYAESPYFIIRDEDAREQMDFLQEKKISAVLLTNSLYSTDSLFVGANFYPRVSFYQNIVDTKMYVYGGESPADSELIRNEDGSVPTENAIWGIHSKTIVFSDQSFAIGTFNLDPRSANINTELMVFCDGSPKLAKFVTDNMLSRISQSKLVMKDGMLENGDSIFDGIGFFKRVKFKLMKFPSNWFSYLL